MRIDVCPWPTQCHETPMQWLWLFGIHRSMSFVLSSVKFQDWFNLWCLDAGLSRRSDHLLNIVHDLASHAASRGWPYATCVSPMLGMGVEMHVSR
ncbi:hypothetical protein KVT40_007867 [Elsinoe batatas]|uniref:Uncharacterized protein n=1 Tax=Elsinoe batatas TaxID=2601811 RepID=A0A8K0KWY4_9PEZI|nr:hypothetical protein KVT40_007867 [Elsinoe batatas]